jgi:hypothetical protein
MGYLTRGFLQMASVTGEDEYIGKAENCLEWLLENRSPGYSNLCWGNHYDFASRAFILPKHEPIIVWTSLIGQAFLDAYERTGEVYYLDNVRSICRFILEDLPIEKTWAGSCISYVSFGQVSIHNSNMLGAAMLARASKYLDSREALDVAKSAMEYSCTFQLPDGGWWYGEEKKYHWIDNFHTGYNLDSLKCYTEYSGDNDYDDHLKWGLSYYKSIFFNEEGRPGYYSNSPWPIDIQCASQAIDTLANFSTADRDSLDLAIKVASWTIENMQDASGYFYYRILPYMKIKTPMFHWGQATMYHALAHLLAKIDIRNELDMGGIK